MALAPDQLEGLEREIYAAVLGTGSWAREVREPVSAAFVAALMRAADANATDGPRTLTLSGLALDGPLDLTAFALGLPLILTNCGLPGLVLREGSFRTFDLRHCELGDADLTGAKIDGSLWIVKSTCSGPLVLRQTSVTRNVNLTGTSITGAKGRAIDGNRLAVEGEVILRDGFKAARTLRLGGAKLGGQLACEGAELSGLELEMATIGGDLLLRPRRAGVGEEQTSSFSSVGEVRLSGARVGGVLECGGEFTAAPVALRANGVTVGVNLQLGRDFTAEGEVRIVGSRVDRDLICRAERLRKGDRVALDLSRTTVGGMLFYAPQAVDGAVKVSGANVGRLEDAVDSWPSERELDGLEYGSIGSVPSTREATVSDRLAWLDGPYRPQPYEQLIAHYRRRGLEGEARTVGLRKQRRRRATLPSWQRPWGYLLDGLLGYGYYPALALLWMLGLLVIGTAAFALLQNSTDLVARGGTMPQPKFIAPLYTLDLLVPIVNLRQRDAWIAVSPLSQIVTTLYLILGWVIGTAAVAALAGLVRRD